MAVLLAALAAYFYFVELPSERAKGEAERREKQLLSFDERAIDGLTVRTRTGEMVLTAEQGIWKLTAPLQAKADQREVQSFIRAFVLGHVSRVFDQYPKELGPFGLDPPSSTVILKAGDRQESLRIGDTGPISSTLYVLRDSDHTLLLTDLSARDVLNKSLFTFRDKAILQAGASSIDRVRLSYPKLEIVLYRAEEQAKSKWMIRAPIEANADQPAVRSLLFKLGDLKAVGFIDPGLERESVSKRLRQPHLKVTVHAKGTDHAVALFQPAPASGEAYAVTTPDAPIYRVNPAIVKDLTPDLFTLQDKRLLGLERDEITKLAVKTGENTYTLVKQSTEWVLEDQPSQPLDQPKIDLLVSRIADFPAELRVSEKPAQLDRYGLTNPSLEVIASGTGGKSGRLLLGARVDGLVYALGQGLSGVSQARADLLTQIPPRKDLALPLPKAS